MGVLGRENGMGVETDDEGRLRLRPKVSVKVSLSWQDDFQFTVLKTFHARKWRSAMCQLLKVSLAEAWNSQKKFSKKDSICYKQLPPYEAFILLMIPSFACHVTRHVNKQGNWDLENTASFVVIIKPCCCKSSLILASVISEGNAFFIRAENSLSASAKLEGKFLPIFGAKGSRGYNDTYRAIMRIGKIPNRIIKINHFFFLAISIIFLTLSLEIAVHLFSHECTASAEKTLCKRLSCA
jgi:hypothetical protein